MARRAQVDIDINVGSITGLPEGGGGGGGSTGGGGGGGGSAGGGGDNVIPGLGNIAGLANMFAFRRQLLSLGNLLPAGLSAPAIMGIVAAVGLLLGMFMMARSSIMLMWRAASLAREGFLALMRMGVAAAETLIAWYVRLAQTIVGTTVRAVQWLGEQTVYWAKRGAEALAGMVRTGVAAYAELQQSAAATATVIGQFGAAAMASRTEVERFAIEMSSRMRYMASEVADAMYQIYSYGYTTRQEVESLTEAALNLASATLYGIENTTMMMAAVMTAFKIPAQYAAQVSDILFNAVRYSAAEMSKLVEAMKYAGPAAAMFGMSLKDTVALLEGFYQVGLKGSMAGVYFRQTLISLSREIPNARKAFAAFGADLKEFSVIRTGSLIASLEKLDALRQRIGQKAFTQMIINAFGTRGAYGIMAAMAASVQQIKLFRSQLDEQGVAAKAAADQLNTLAGAWQLLKNNLQNLETLVIRGPVASWFMAFVGVLRQLIETARQSGAIGALQGVLINLVAGFGALLKYLGPTAIGAIRDILLSLGAAIWQMFQGAVKLLPSIIGFLQWLPRLFSYAFAQLVPMIVRFGQAFIPLLLQIAGVVLPMLVQALAGVGNFLAAFLEQNSGQIVLWFQWFAYGVLSVVAALPQLLPMLASIVNAFVYLAPLIINAAVTGIPALIAAAQQLLPWLIALAYRGVAVLLLFMEYFRTHLSSHMIPTVMKFLGAIMRVLDFIIAKWPQITKLLDTMAWTVYTVVTALDGVLTSVLSRLGKYLDYLDGHGKTVILNMIDLVRSLLALMGTQLAVQAMGALIGLEAAYAFLPKELKKDAAAMMDFLKEQIRTGIPDVVRDANRALRGLRTNAEQFLPPDKLGPQAMLAPPPGLAPAGYNPQGSNQIVVEQHYNIDPNEPPSKWVKTIIRDERKQEVRYVRMGGLAPEIG